MSGAVHLEPTVASGRTALAITLGVIGILTFAAAMLSVS
jgi:hypothetical protein